MGLGWVSGWGEVKSTLTVLIRLRQVWVVSIQYIQSGCHKLVLELKEGKRGCIQSYPRVMGDLASVKGFI